MDIIIGKEFPKKVIPLIESSKSSIDIIVFDWRWYSQDPGASVQLFNQSIVRAVRRGVRVRAIANNDDIIHILKNVGCFAKRLKIANLVHCKIIIIDSKILVTGSHNYTQSAFQLNVEFSVILDDEKCALESLKFFDSLFNS